MPGDNWDHYGPNVIVECVPLPLRERAKHFRDGIEVITPSLRRTPPDSLSPRAKMHQYLNLVLADREVKAQNPQAWAVLLDVNGNLAEGQGSNIFPGPRRPPCDARGNAMCCRGSAARR